MEKLKAEICDLYFLKEELEYKFKLVTEEINKKKRELADGQKRPDNKDTKELDKGTQG